MTTPPGFDPQLKDLALRLMGDIHQKSMSNSAHGRHAWTVMVGTDKVVGAIQAQLKAMSTVDADVTAEKLDAIARRAFRLNLYLRFIAAMDSTELGLTLRDCVFFQIEIPEP